MAMQKTSSRPRKPKAPKKEEEKVIEIPFWLQNTTLIQCRSIQDVHDMVDVLMSSSSPIAYDVETTGLRSVDDYLVSIQFANSPDKAWFIPLAMNNGMLNLDAREVFEVLTNRLFPFKGFIGHNIKYDYKMTKKYAEFDILADTLLDCVQYDTEIMGKGLKDLGKAFFPSSPVLELKSFFPKKTAIRFDLIKEDYALAYACQDVMLTHKLYTLFTNKGVNRDSFIYKLELQLIKVVAEMELLGVQLDLSVIRKGKDEATALLADLQSKIDALANRPVELSKVADLKKLLYHELGLQAPKLTPGGQLSTDADALEKLQSAHPIVPLILEYRKVTKLITSFLEPLPNLVESDLCLHPSFNQLGAATGRFSCSEPNLQQVPKDRSKEGQETPVSRLTAYLRKAIIPPMGYVGFFDADYAQIEYVMFASLSQEPSLIDAFNTGVDVHLRTASIVFGKKESDVSTEDRQRGKTLNFSILYGATEIKIAEQLKVSRVEARNILKMYWQKLPIVQKFIEDTHANASRYNYAETFFGRRRHLHHINGTDYGLKSYNQRQSVSQRCQGTAADLVKIAMVRLYNTLKERGLKSKICLTVHDEIVVAHHPSDDPKLVAEAIKESMEVSIDSWAPIRAEIDYGKNWKEVKPVDSIDFEAQPSSVVHVSPSLTFAKDVPTIIINSPESPQLQSTLDKYAGDDYYTCQGQETPKKVNICRQLLFDLKTLKIDYTLNNRATSKLLYA